MVRMADNFPDDLKAHCYSGKYKLVTEDKELGKHVLCLLNRV